MKLNKLSNNIVTLRFQKVTIDGVYSKPAPLTTTVPQRSVLRPPLFTLYMAPVGDIMSDYGMPYPFYADDTQIYVFCNVKDSSDACILLENCIRHVETWMSLNYLNLSNEKKKLF